MDDFEQAKIHFTKCLEVDIEEQTAIYNVVYCYEFLDQNEEALVYLNEYLDRNPYAEIGWHQAGRLYYHIKDYTNAIRAFEFATYIDDEFLGAFMEMGKAFEKVKNYDKAIESYQKTIELDDPTSYALLRIGKCHEKLGNKTIAIKYYNKTVHEDPLLDKGWIAITDFYIREKNFSKALYFVNKALGIDNENKLYWKRFASINKELNFFEEAEYGYRKAVQYGDNQLDTWLYWVDVLQFQGEFEMAKNTLLMATEFFPESFEIEYRLAGLNYMDGKLVKGKFHLCNGLRLSYKNHDLIKNLFPVVWDRKVVQTEIEKHNN